MKTASSSKEMSNKKLKMLERAESKVLTNSGIVKGIGY